jgi:hypothetical protein
MLYHKRTLAKVIDYTTHLPERGVEKLIAGNTGLTKVGGKLE